MAVNASGDVFVTGYSSDTGQNFNMRTIKYRSADGVELWSAAFNSANNSFDVANAITVDANGNPFVTGYSTDTVGGKNFRTVKYDGITGAELWSASYNGLGNGVDYGTAIAANAGGNVFVTGVSNDATDATHIRTIKYHGVLGFELWSTAYNHPGIADDLSYAMAIDAGGDVVVTGSSYDGASAVFNMRTIKYSGVTGAELWNAVYSGSGNSTDAGTAVAIDASGDVIVTGYSFETTGGTNVRTVKYNGATGVQMWTRGHNGSANGTDIGYAVATTPDGSIIVFGTSNETGKPQGLFIQKLTNSNGQPNLLSVLSRKTHGAAGDFDVVIDATPPITGTVSVEPRVIGGGHVIVFQFDGPVDPGASAAAVNAAGASFAGVTAATLGNAVAVTLPNVPENSRATVSLSGVNGGVTTFSASMGFLVGDVNDTRSVNSSDISAVKARSGQTTTALNFKFDVNASGAINSSDISAVKARSGLVLP